MDKARLAREIRETCRLTGEFRLRSGRVADTYFDKYRFEGDPRLLQAVTDHLVPLVPADTDVLAGLELGGVPLAAALSLATGLPAAFVRKEAKTYGTCRLAEGAAIEGRRALVVEDVVTTGGQVVESVGEMRGRGATVERALCVIDRSGGDHSPLQDARLELIALFTLEELESA